MEGYYPLLEGAYTLPTWMLQASIFPPKAAAEIRVYLVDLIIWRARRDSNQRSPA